MKKLITSTILLILMSNILAQEGGQIQGTVLDADGNALAFAATILFSEDSAIAKTGYTNQAGQYLLTSVEEGNYSLKIQYSGLASYQSEVFAVGTGQQLNREEVVMTVAETELEEVKISAQKALIEVRPDKTIFNVAGTAIGIGETAFELLRKAPGVVIDNNENIMLMGKSGVRIYIDGKPSPLSVADLAAMLKGMQSDQIESMEIITNPSARYDAEGNAGIINIRLKKDKNLGTNGSASLGYARGRFNKYSGSINLNHRNKRVNVFGNYSGGFGKSYSFTDFFRKQNGIEFDQHTDRFSEYANHNFKAGADVFLSENHTIGIMTNGFVTNNDIRSESLTPIRNQLSGEAINTLEALNIGPSDRTSLNVNLNYRFKNKAGTTWNVDADYGLYRFESTSFQPNYYLDPIKGDTMNTIVFANETPTMIDIYTLKVDHERKLWKGTFSAGAKTAVIRTDNQFNFFNVVDNVQTLNLDRSNQFQYRENIHAAYAIYQRRLNKWNMEIGLRGEQTITTGTLISVQQTGLDTVERQYLNLFPTGGLTYSLNRSHSLGLNYSRRIDRPRYQSLNPFVNQLDQLTFSRGNPFLRPQYSHNIQLSHTYKYRYSTSISYSLTEDYFTQITDTFQSEASFITQENLASREVISANVSAPISIKKWWSTYTNLNVNRTRHQGDFNLPGETGKDIDLTQTSFNIFQQHTFSLPGNISLELSGFYNSPSIWGANYRNRQFWGINGGAQVRLLNQKAIVKVSVSDIFYSMQWRGVQEYGALYFDASGGYESRQVKINFTYNFGNDRVKASRKRKSGLQDESRRIGG
ncbi:MAG: outer membrane beta-barrel protein [Bacteroidota bacterium]